jgi:hypothetical protein
MGMLYGQSRSAATIKVFRQVPFFETCRFWGRSLS